MSVGSLVRSSYLLYFSLPAHDRALYKALRSRPIRSIVEIGIGSGERTLRVLEVAGWGGTQPIRYTGIDLFEARPGPARWSLKQAFAALSQPTVQVRLVPGEAGPALARAANSLAGTDLLLIAADHDREALARAWPWMPRMLTPQALIFLEQPAGRSGSAAWKQLALADVERYAADAGKQRRAA